MSITDLTNITVETERPTFDRFKMDRNEKSRILIPSTKIAQFYVHVFHNEEPAQIEQNGRTVSKWDTSSFAGMYICTGDVNKVSKNPRFGDPAGCPACAAMQDTTKPQLVEFAKKTFSMNIIQFSTKPNSYDLRNRNVSVKVWKHGDAAKIQPVQLAAQQTDISKIDFLIETDGTEWKKMNINVSLDGSASLKDEKLAEAVKELVENELYDDQTLITACGRQLTSDELDNEVNQLYRQYEASHGVSTNGASADDGFDDDGAEAENELEGLDDSALSNLLD